MTRRAATLLIPLAFTACVPGVARLPSPAPGIRLPAVPDRDGPLTVTVAYPAEGQTLTAADSNFIFGDVGTGRAALVINGSAVDVAANGAFLAYLPVPPDGVYHLVATNGSRDAQLTRHVNLPARAPSGGPEPTTGLQPDSIPADSVTGSPSDSLAPGPDTAHVAEFPRAAVVASRRPDATAIGTAVPGSGTPYNWFFPTGTRLEVVGRKGDQYRIRLTSTLSVWVDSAELRLLPRGTPAVNGAVAEVRAVHSADWIDVHVATSDRLPFRVDAADSGAVVTVYGAKTRTNWLRYGDTDGRLRRMEWEQVTDDVYRLDIELNEPLWGYLAFWAGNGDLVIRLRRPPAVDRDEPLRGLRIAIDAGHPPGGAIGPTGLTEADANLAIARKLSALLRARGAHVIETRPDTSSVALGARPKMATDSGAYLLVSVHNNAFPDGVNPWVNNGTSAFYNHAPSRELARDLERELLREFGLRDLGIARADLALVRPTWMPAVLTETMFLMIPQQEAALRDSEVQERIARAHLRGIEDYLRSRAHRHR